MTTDLLTSKEAAAPLRVSTGHRLNAAAPKMLEALQRLQRRGYLNEHPCAGDGGNADLAFARDAIFEATGQ